MEMPSDFAATTDTLKEVLEAFRQTILKNGLAVQAARRHGDENLVSCVVLPDAQTKILEALDQKMRSFIQKGRGDFGCATSTVPNGPDVHVVVVGAMSDKALTLLAETLAQKAAQRFAGASLA
jgi:hypothetical protein